MADEPTPSEPASKTVDGRTTRWLKMTPEEKAAQISKMQAGRKLRKS